MKVLVERSLASSVSINNKIVGKIDKGLVLLVGFTEGDNEEIVNKVMNKIVSLRLFADEQGKTNLAFTDIGGEILCISQFSLYADIKKGRRPSFINAMRPERATKLYDYTISYLKTLVPVVKQGIFGADMKVELLNNGPFTLMIDSKDL